jgi:hypothetical protein
MKLKKAVEEANGSNWCLVSEEIRNLSFIINGNENLALFSLSRAVGDD